MQAPWVVIAFTCNIAHILCYLFESVLRKCQDNEGVNPYQKSLKFYSLSGPKTWFIVVMFTVHNNR